MIVFIDKFSKSMRTCCSALCMYVLLSAVPAVAQEARVAVRQNVPNAITQAAFGRGAMKCSTRIQQVTNFANAGPDFNAVLTLFPSDPDNGLLSVIQGVETAQGPVYVSSTYAPNQASGCQAAYDAVSFYKKSCQEVASETFKDLKEGPQQQKSIKVLDGGLFLKVFLLSVDTGCVSIKKEVIYQ